MDHECITLRMLGGSDNIWTFKSKNGEPLNLTVKGGFVCDNTLPAVELAKLGMGIVYAPYYSLATELAAGQLVPCLKKERCIDLQAWLIFQRRDILPCAYRRYSTASAPISKTCLICCFKLRARWPAQDPAAR
ncbi:LysR family transcriptional regulator [Klebsiella aerogenes]|nr:LysR family transcriptional regulator [Klebsiella aerogenes]